MNNKQDKWVNEAQMINNSACDKHREAINRGTMQRIRKVFSQSNNQLAVFDNVYAGAKVKHEHDAGVRPVDIKNIIGSVKVCKIFDRDFNPRGGHNGEVWLKYARAVQQGQNLPAITLIQIGLDYYVIDGHHRISVAKSFRRAFIDAHVIELELDTTAMPYMSQAELVPSTKRIASVFGLSLGTNG